MQYDAVQFSRGDQLAAQTAARLPWRDDDVEHGVFHLVHGRASGQPGFVDIDMASGARQTTAALASHARDAVHLRGVHQVGAIVHVVAHAVAIAHDPVHLGHGGFFLLR